MLRAVTRSKVNPLVPCVALLVGAGVAAAGHSWIGAGLAVGGALAYFNGLVLSRRVDLAAATGDAAGALMVMQVGLLVTMTVVGVATVVMVKLSPPMALAAAAAFGVTWLAILATYYLAHGRTAAAGKTQAT